MAHFEQPVNSFSSSSSHYTPHHTTTGRDIVHPQPRMHQLFSPQLLLLLVIMPLLCAAFTATHRRCLTSHPPAVLLLHTTAAARAGIRHRRPLATSLSSSTTSSSSLSSSACSFPSSSSTKSPLPHLSLVLDINKTILLEDPAGGKDVQALLNEAISELAYGRVDQTQQQNQQQQQRQWIADPTMPLHVGPKPRGSPPSLVSYASFVHDTYPDLPGINLKQIKAIRDGLKGTFTLPGQPGHRFASEVTELTEALQLPPGLSPALLETAGLTGRQRVGLLPAFFHFLRRLQKEQQQQQMENEKASSSASTPPVIGSKNQKEKSSAWRFAVQFRTFGEDLPRIIQEYNAFVRGQHPLFPGQGLGTKKEGEGEEGREDDEEMVDYALDLVGDPECFGCMFRDADGPPALILGTFHPPTSRADLQALLHAQEKKQQQQQQQHRILEGIPAIHAFMQQRQASSRPSLAIRDYWPWWRHNLEASEAGKLVPLFLEGGRERGRGDEGLPLQRGGEGGREDEWFTVVMDDNIEHSRAHIIDLRCAKTGEVVPFEEGVEGGHLVRAEPYLAIRDPKDYFWECLQASLSRRRRRRRREGGRKGPGEDGGRPPVGG